MAAKWVYNIFDADWLWALHQKDDVYWQQNKHIVDHAWQRWKSGDGLEWLQIVARRIHPSDPLATEVLADITPFLHRNWKDETIQYQGWLLDVWAQALRIRLGRKEYSDAVALVAQHNGFSELQYSPYQTYPVKVYERVLQDALRWLVYVGEAEVARSVLSNAAKVPPTGFAHWKVLLATDWQSAVAANYSYSPEGEAFEGAHSVGLWYKMVNNVSMHELVRLSRDEQLAEEIRALLIRSALSRAILLGEPKSNIDDYAADAVVLNSGLAEALETAMEAEDIQAYTELFFFFPRLRPLPYLSYAYDGYLRYGSQQYNAEPRRIDIYNHNDNNWWCRVDQNRLGDAVFEAVEIRPNAYYRSRFSLFRGKLFKDSDALTQEINQYRDIQKKLIADHPYHSRVKRDETAALETIPSGPEYISQEAIKQAGGGLFGFWTRIDDTEKAAQQLHAAIRSTRYGCQRDGSHTIYSRKAYKILHEDYANTPWAHDTPYWFGCKHFRGGCPQ